MIKLSYENKSKYLFCVAQAISTTQPMSIIQCNVCINYIVCGWLTVACLQLALQ